MSSLRMHNAWRFWGPNALSGTSEQAGCVCTAPMQARRPGGLAPRRSEVTEWQQPPATKYGRF